MGLVIQANGVKLCFGMEKEVVPEKMAVSTKVTEDMIKRMVMEGQFTLMVMYIKDHGLMEKHMEKMGNIYIRVDRNMKEIGKQIYKMAREQKLDLMDRNMSEVLQMDKKAAKVSSHGVIIPVIEESFQTEISTEMESINEEMEKSTKANEKTIKWTVKVYSSERMAEFTMAFMQKIRKKVLEFINDQLGQFMKAFDLMENNMAKEN